MTSPADAEQVGRFCCPAHFASNEMMQRQILGRAAVVALARQTASGCTSRSWRSERAVARRSLTDEPVDGVDDGRGFGASRSPSLRGCGMHGDAHRSPAAHQVLCENCHRDRPGDEPSVADVGERPRVVEISPSWTTNLAVTLEAVEDAIRSVADTTWLLVRQGHENPPIVPRLGAKNLGRDPLVQRLPCHTLFLDRSTEGARPFSASSRGGKRVQGISSESQQAHPALLRSPSCPSARPTSRISTTG